MSGLAERRFLGTWGLRGPLATLVLAVSATAVAIQSQQEPSLSLREKLSRVGVFFRADAPWALRNPGDPFLPVYLEVINGVEKTARSTGDRTSGYFTRDPLQLEGVNIYVRPAGKAGEFVSEPLLLGESKDFSIDFRTAGKPLAVADRMKKIVEITREKIDSYLRLHYSGGPFGTVDMEVAFRVKGWPAQEFYLRARLDAPPLPAIPRWYRGDIHYHAAFTDNPAERGYPLSVTKQAALDAGLDWLMLTDHSTDLTPDKYADELRQVSLYRDGRLVMIRGEEVTVASARDSWLTTVHLLALPSPENPDKGFPGLPRAGTLPQDSVIMTGTGAPSSPAMPLEEALDRIASSGGFAYAAHPFDPVSPVVRGGSWDVALDFLAASQNRLRPGLVGLEAWNRATTATANDARDPFCLHRGTGAALASEPSPGSDTGGCFQLDSTVDQYVRLEKAIELAWTPLLVKGLGGLELREKSSDFPSFKTFLAAGSDAHGDLNYEATFDVVDFLSKFSRAVSGYAENNALGRLTTLAYCPEGMGPRGETVLAALRDGRSVMSNGPLLVAGFDRDSNGSLDDPDDVGIGQTISSPLKMLPPLALEWVSTEEFGPFTSLRLIVGLPRGESQPVDIPIPPSKALTSNGLFPVDLQSRFEKAGATSAYVRLEARTRNRAGEEFRCYTNPIWVRLIQP